jgi:plasmid stability protein
MSQLLVRNIEPIILKKLKARALSHGISVEEEHRRILRTACLQTVQKASLIEFLRNPANAASPNVDLDITRS